MSENSESLAFKIGLYGFAMPVGCLILLSPFAVIFWLAWWAWSSLIPELPEPWPHP